MLDDLKVIHERDAQDAFGVVEKQWQQLTHDFGFSWQAPREIFDVVIVGMGGSGLAAKVFAVWPGLDVPVTIVQDYDLPSHVNEHTLLICSSYSGNTEEVLSVLAAATEERKEVAEKPMVVTMAAGGELLATAERLGVPSVTLPSGLQPRFTLGYQLKALIDILEQTSLLAGASAQLAATASWLEEEVAALVPTVPTDKNQAKQLAQELMGKSPVIYAGPLLAPAAYKWKIDINECAKNVAWCGTLPEFNHNEFIGWTGQPVDKPYATIDLRSSLEHPRVQKRFEISQRLLSGQRPATHAVTVRGDDRPQQLLWAIIFGDFVSLYLAILNGVNPTPVELIEKLKQEMND